jgi:riboflavin kinase / FMN adenylyltransferase
LKIWTDILDFPVKNPVVTIGIFDGVHLGHRYLLEQLKIVADKVRGETVVVTLWPHPRVVLNKNPENLRYLTSLNEKVLLLEETHLDHLIILPFTEEFAELESCKFVKTFLVDKINMKHLVVGYNHKFGKNREGDFERLKECADLYNFTIDRMVPKSINGVKLSSSLIRELLNSDDLSLANYYLGYDYFLQGKVVGGNKLGRKIGFPTANVLPDDPHKLIPRDGVYAVQVRIEGNIYNGMMNVGYRPTIETGMPIKTIEVNLFNFTKDIYNNQVTIYFRKRIRNEKKFGGIEHLREQLVKDRSEAQKILKDYKGK